MNKNTKPTECAPNAETRELSPDALDMVNGVGDPFADIPRVPANPIDEEVRDKG